VPAVVFLLSVIVVVGGFSATPPTARPGAPIVVSLHPEPTAGTAGRSPGPSYDPIVTEMGCLDPSVDTGAVDRCYIGISWDHGTADGTHGGPTNWTSTSPGGSFTPYPTNATPDSDCYISAGQSGACVVYVDYVDSDPGAPTLTASFDCGGTCPVVSGSTNITEEGNGTNVVCDPNPVEIDQASVCTATVLGSVSPPPSGKVDWSTTSFGAAFNASFCTLVASPNGSSCSVTWTDPSLETGVKITASYQGDPNNPKSTGNTTISVDGTEVTYPVTFQESGLPAGATWSATVATSTATSTTDEVTIEEPNSFAQPNGVYIYGVAEAGFGNARYMPSVPNARNGIHPPVCPDPTCGVVGVSTGPVTIYVVYGQTWQTNWLPSRDTYVFPNPGSIYSPDGNCYGISETEVLYWYNEVDGNTAYPYLPLQPTAAQDTAGLTESQGWLSWSNGAFPPYTLNNASLAITLHQTLDPEATAAVRTLDSSTFDQSREFNLLEADVAFPGGVPTVIAMGSPNPSGSNTYYHAVIVYGMTQYPNGSWQFDISDPNLPSQASTAWYDPSGTSFVYNDGYNWRQFIPVPAQLLEPSFINGQTTWNQPNYHGVPAYDFVVSTVPVTIKTLPADILGHRISFYDSFGDDGGGDSQTLSATIGGSVGIEEGSMQAYGIPSGTQYSIDPPATNASLLDMWYVNSSGSSLRYGFTVGTEAPGPGDFNVTPNSNGFNLTATDTLTVRNVSFSYANSTGYTVLQAYNLTIAGGSTARFAVTSWQGLNSSHSSSVTLEVYEKNSTTPYATYALTNGEDGLPPATPASTPPTSAHSTPPALPIDWIVYGGIALVIVAVVAIVLYRRRDGPRDAP
jgi:hypothetical protein